MVGVGLALLSIILTAFLKWLDIRRENRKEREDEKKQVEMTGNLDRLSERINTLEARLGGDPNDGVALAVPL